MTQNDMLQIVDPVVAKSFEMALRKDSDDDYRALIKAGVGQITRFVPTNDPVPHTPQGKQAALADAATDITFFNDMNGLYGTTDSVGGTEMLVNWSLVAVQGSTQAPDTVVHEYGHLRGLEHPSAGTDRMNIMQAGDGATPAIPGANKLKKAQVDFFE